MSYVVTGLIPGATSTVLVGWVDERRRELITHSMMMTTEATCVMELPPRPSTDDPILVTIRAQAPGYHRFQVESIQESGSVDVVMEPINGPLWSG